MNHVKFISNPNYWTKWPLLPIVQRHGQDPKTGFLIGDPVPPIKVYLGNIWDLPMSQDELNQLPSISYSSVEELVKDGWEVD